MSNKESCIELLIKRQRELSDAGEARLPKRSDFSSQEVCAIKAFLGPWPRALEAAGLKPPCDKINKNTEKHILAKRRRTAEKLKKQFRNSETNEGASK